MRAWMGLICHVALFSIAKIHVHKPPPWRLYILKEMKLKSARSTQTCCPVTPPIPLKMYISVDRDSYGQ